MVLSNPLQIAVGLEPEDVAMAICGDPTVSVALGRDGESLGSQMIYGLNGRLTNYHHYISAVVTLDASGDWEDEWLRDNGYAGAPLEERLAASTEARQSGGAPSGEHLAATVIETPRTAAGEAVRLPGSIFDGPLDRRFSWDAEGVLVPA